ncbi:GTP pyrophosphokinaseppGpp synthetase I [Mucinivorans hirudinis]|uniref:GTP pyrophosphokinaseppGpp synthetase I n=1 Tax=Mucinivorans hirudinis TaxID=1433126 RepID=A0A060R7Q1_9BACT|nr:GTP pyrophosphokinaseppGpp synthetase I [Mucinivorans hirudinis]
MKEFLVAIKQNYSEKSARAIVSALRRANFELRNEHRYDGSPMVMHSVAMARIVCTEIGLGRDSVIASLLHDVTRMGMITRAQIVEQYGEEVAVILGGMNSISAVDTKTSSLQVDNFRELIVSYSKDPRVILLKMADRLEVMRSLSIFPELKRNKKSWETIHLYAQIAHKLGLYNIKSEMEDLALKHLETKEYSHIERRLSETADERNRFIAEFVKPIQERLTKLGIKYHLKSRTKSIYSIWKKMKKQRVGFDEVFDIFAIRIIINCEAEFEKMQCWTAFSVVTDFYTHNPGRMRDWITIPKSTGYESLHATVVTKQGRWVEVQIRTERMDEQAEHGVAAHWRYKGVSDGGQSSEQWLESLRGVIENLSHSDPIDEQFDITLSTNEVFVFTPNGDLRKLPDGATVLDFAFDIHSNLGMVCTGAVVNGRKVSFRETLRSGDIVEIQSSKSQKPKLEWLKYVVTSKARGKIKQYLREEQASSLANLGREELERKLRNWKMNITIEDAVTALVKHYKLKTGLEVYSLIAEGKINLLDAKEIIKGEPQVVRSKPKKEKQHKDIQTDIIFDNSLKGLSYKLARCCNPIYGDDVFGFVTINSGITVHRTDCPNARRLEENFPYRKIAAKWGGAASAANFSAVLEIRGDDRPSLAGNITDVIGQQLKINIRSMAFNSHQGQFTGTVAIEVANTSIVDMVIYNLKKVDGVRKIERVK